MTTHESAEAKEMIEAPIPGGIFVKKLLAVVQKNIVARR